MKSTRKLVSILVLVGSLSACGPTESTKTTTTSTKMDSAATMLVDSVSTLGTDSAASAVPSSTTN